MAVFRIKQGRDIRLTGAASKEIDTLPLPGKAVIQFSDFKGLKPRLCAKVNDAVKVGSPLFEDKTYPQIKVASPLSGKVSAIQIGEKRALLEIVIESDGKQDAVTFPKYNKDQIANISSRDVTKRLLEGGLWPVIRQRPFSKIPHPDVAPKSIFIHAMNTEPLALAVDFILEGKEERFQAGIEVLRRLTKGKVYLCAGEGAQSKALTRSKNVETHYFSGPHPAGNVSTHIHYLDPILKGDHVWYVEAQDVLRIAALFLGGVYSPERFVAVTGEGAPKRSYVQTVVGAPLSLLLRGHAAEGMRYISGSVLKGKDVGSEGSLGFYDSQVTVIPEGGKRELLGWMSPGFGKYTFSKTYASSFLPSKEVSLTSDKNGSERAIVFNNIYDSLVPLDIMTYFLLKAVLIGDIEEAERLGILECDEEDFALCTFACPSKTDVGEIIRDGLEYIEREG